MDNHSFTNFVNSQEKANTQPGLLSSGDNHESNDSANPVIPPFLGDLNIKETTTKPMFSLGRIHDCH